MALGVTSKLFIAVLVVNIITAAAVGLGVRTARFVSGLPSPPILEREEVRPYAPFSTALANGYREKGGWEFLKGSDEAWAQLNREVRPDFRRRRGPDGVEVAKGPPREPRAPPAVVLDMRGNVIAGDAEIGGNAKTRPIVVEGEQVGWLLDACAPPALRVRRPPFPGRPACAPDGSWHSRPSPSPPSSHGSSRRGLLTPVKRPGGGHAAIG